MMKLLRRPAFLSVIALALIALGLKALLGGMVVPRMLERGNVLMVRGVVPPLEHYFVDFQAWPTGPAEETMWRLQGAKNDVIEERAIEGIPAPATPKVRALGPGKPNPNEVTSVRRQRLPSSPNYLPLGTPVRTAGLTLGDAWGRPLEFTFIPQGPATVTSLGADGVLGTADDVTATANIRPRRTHPTRALFVADREFRRQEQARRTLRKLAEKVE